ncbi:MAG: hypothetical protein KDC74_04685 [Flavobacteriaceae bacterium]|nr:hypothetical protein [Flavobacteriaceae bacterium]
MCKKFCLITVGFLLQLNVFSQTLEYPKWQEGVLELHHISTGRGDAAFYIFPDGTTMLVDVGDTSETHPRTLSDRNVPLLPNRTKSAPEWIVEYIKQFHPNNRQKQLDYALITHYHDDHFGEVDSTRMYDKKGGYQLTGITTVGTTLPIKIVLDRGYNFPVDFKDAKIQQKINEHDSYKMIPTLKNYWKFIEYQKNTNGLEHQVLQAGVKDQIVLNYFPKKYPNFLVRNIAVNGMVWTGEGDNNYKLYTQDEYVGENSLSTCIKISYGKFDYFTGGDINGVDGLGETDFNRVESHIAPVVGPVDVATLNHHGNRDSQNKFYVRTIRPRVWIGQTWSSDHPDNNVLRRLLSDELYPGERDVFATAMLASNISVIGGMIDKYKSKEGHIVVRVYDNGDRYEVYVLNEKSENREVKQKFGPYESR